MADQLVYANPAWRAHSGGHAGVGTGGGRRPRDLHARLPGYRVTPLIDLPEVAAEVGVAQVWIKDESTRLGLPAFKVLGASWAVYRALEERAGGAFEPWGSVAELAAQVARLGPLRLVAATDGNHGRAVARMARLLGLAATIFVPAGTAAARAEAIRSEGAHVVVVEGTYDDAVAESAALGRADPEGTLVVSDMSWEGYQQIPRWVIEGYDTMYAEADEQGADPTRVVVQMGVGALAAATVAHYRPRGARVAVVEPLDAACGLRAAQVGRPVAVPGPHRSIMAGLNCGIASPAAWPVLATGVDLFVAVADSEAERAVRDLATLGVDAGETGAAGLAGLRALAAEKPAVLQTRDRVLLVCTEGPTDPEAFERLVGRRPRPRRPFSA